MKASFNAHQENGRCSYAQQASTLPWAFERLRDGGGIQFTHVKGPSISACKVVRTELWVSNVDKWQFKVAWLMFQWNNYVISQQKLCRKDCDWQIKRLFQTVPSSSWRRRKRHCIWQHWSKATMPILTATLAMILGKPSPVRSAAACYIQCTWSYSTQWEYQEHRQTRCWIWPSGSLWTQSAITKSASTTPKRCNRYTPLPEPYPGQ